jgi:hypothetical protein
LAVVKTAQFVWQGRRYCWYDDGWRGPGWYWCGYHWHRGVGWGGPVDGTVGIDRFTGPELIAQAAIARVSTDQAAIAQVSIVRGAAIARQVVARGIADDRSPLVLASSSLIHCIFCSSDTGGFLPAGLAPLTDTSTISCENTRVQTWKGGRARSEIDIFPSRAFECLKGRNRAIISASSRDRRVAVLLSAVYALNAVG